MITQNMHPTGPGFIRSARPLRAAERVITPRMPGHKPTPAAEAQPERPCRQPIFTREFVEQNPEAATEALNAAYYDLVELEKRCNGR